jgi:hypothetical protein
MISTKKLLAIFLLFPLLLGIACRRTSPDPTATPTDDPQVMAEPASTEPVISPAATETSGSLTADGQDLMILDQTMIQRSDMVFAAFQLINTDSDRLFEDVDFRMAVYDAGGNKLDESYIYIAWVFPGQQFWLTNEFYLGDSNIAADSLSLTWDFRDNRSASGRINPFSTENTCYWHNENYPIVTGIINNLEPDTYRDLRVNVVSYDANGNVAGGAYTYVDFIPGNDFVGFSVYLNAFDDIASVEAYPTFSYSQEIFQGTDFWGNISIVDDYFYPGDFGWIMGGLVLQNETNQVLTDSLLYITFYDEDDFVTAIGTDYIDLILPGDSIGVKPWVTSPPEESTTYKYDIWVLPGEPQTDFELTANPFVVTDTQITGDYDDYVNVTFTNTYSKSVSEVDVHVLLYDSAGLILGGGQAWSSEPTPAGGTTTVEVWVDYVSEAVIDSIDVWVLPSYWTEFN